MAKVYVINGSPTMEKGTTALLLERFVQGMRAVHAEVTQVYASRLKINPCSCGRMYCWYKNPGQCVHADDMTSVLENLKEADILVLATPVYIPLPGKMQDLINRLCPMLDPKLVIRDGRTRGRMREGYSLKQIVLIGTSGWWELQNLDALLYLAEELSRNASVEFAGALLRPHASLLRHNDLTLGKADLVLRAAQEAGEKLIEEGSIPKALQAEISQPLVTLEQYMDSA